MDKIDFQQQTRYYTLRLPNHRGHLPLLSLSDDNWLKSRRGLCRSVHLYDMTHIDLFQWWFTDCCMGEWMKWNSSPRRPWGARCQRLLGARWGGECENIWWLWKMRLYPLCYITPLAMMANVCKVYIPFHLAAQGQNPFSWMCFFEDHTLFSIEDIIITGDLWCILRQANSCTSSPLYKGALDFSKICI